MKTSKKTRYLVINLVRMLKTVVVAVALMMTTQAQASLNLVLEATPDIFSDNITVNYNAASGLFTADGFSSTFNKIPLTTPGLFSLTATINGSGIASVGTLAITGVDGSNTSPLLTGTLDKFGYYTTSDTLEFIFKGLGGSLASQYSGGIAGVILSNTGWKPIYFSTDYDNNSYLDALSDTGSPKGSPVPLPGSLLLLAPAMGLLHSLRRRREIVNT